MKASTLMFALQNATKTYGDLPIVGGYLADDTPLKKVILIDENGVDIEDDTKSKPVGIFLSM